MGKKKDPLGEKTFNRIVDNRARSEAGVPDLVEACRYTPGPWEAAEDHFSGEEHCEASVIQWVRRRSCTHSLWAVFAPNGSSALVGAEADARLIAAAPDLVEACRVLVAQLDGFRKAAIDARIWDRDDGDAIEVGRAALRKAGVEP